MLKNVLKAIRRTYLMILCLCNSVKSEEKERYHLIGTKCGKCKMALDNANGFPPRWTYLVNTKNSYRSNLPLNQGINVEIFRYSPEGVREVEASVVHEKDLEAYQEYVFDLETETPLSSAEIERMFYQDLEPR